MVMRLKIRYCFVYDYELRSTMHMNFGKFYQMAECKQCLLHTAQVHLIIDFHMHLEHIMCASASFISFNTTQYNKTEKEKKNVFCYRRYTYSK